MRVKGFISEIWRVASLLGEKVNILDSFRTTEILGILKFSVYNDIVILNFSKYVQNNLNYCSTPIIREVMNFCNLDDQNFETRGLNSHWIDIIHHG